MADNRGERRIKARVEDRIGRFAWVACSADGREFFLLELNAFESGCAMRWLERRWSRGAEWVGSSFFVENNTLFVQHCPDCVADTPASSASFEAWVRHMVRLADQ